MGLFEEIASKAINYIAEENERRITEKAVRKEMSDKEDMLETLVFLMGYKKEITRDEKKLIAEFLSVARNEEVSLFSIEEEIDEILETLSLQKSTSFFKNHINIADRENIIAIYIIVMSTYFRALTEEIVSEHHMYNIYLIKKNLGITRKELVICYTKLAEFLGKSTDEVAEIFEMLTGDEIIDFIKEKMPEMDFNEKEIDISLLSHDELVNMSYSDMKKLDTDDYNEVSRIKREAAEAEDRRLQELEEARPALEKIEELYNEAVNEAGVDAENFKKRVGIAKIRPEMVEKARKSFAKKSIDEKAVIVYDNTLLGNGKAGFLLTNKRLHIHVGVAWHIFNNEDIEDFHTNMFGHIIINGVKNIPIDTSPFTSKDGKNAFSDFFEEVIPLAMKVKDDE